MKGGFVSTLHVMTELMSYIIKSQVPQDGKVILEGAPQRITRQLSNGYGWRVRVECGSVVV